MTRSGLCANFDLLRGADGSPSGFSAPAWIACALIAAHLLGDACPYHRQVFDQRKSKRTAALQKIKIKIVMHFAILSHPIFLNACPSQGYGEVRAVTGEVHRQQVASRASYGFRFSIEHKRNK